MQHLRVKHPPGFQSVLCALTTLPEDRELPYVKEMLRSARERAESLGYGLMVMRIEDASKPRPDLDRVLRSRGVDGLLLLPMETPREFKRLLNWKNYSVVVATHAVLAPEFHRVVPHQYHNMLLLCQELAQRGYRRIGLTLDARHDLAVNHGFSAAVVWHNVLGGTEQVMPLISDDARPQDLQRWFTSEKPDVIIASGHHQAELIARQLGLTVPGPVGFAIANRLGPSLFAGMDERPAEIGAAAIRVLAGMLQHGEKGVPPVPTVTMVQGRWFIGRSVRAVRETRRPRQVQRDPRANAE